MRYISLFSGIEAATVAWEPLGWEPVAFCEIDEFPSAVLEHRFPNVPNLGDITKVDWSDYVGSVDIIVGGSPCQSFSVAGKREGLKGESGLMFEYIRAVREVRPRWFIWENVPGALSSEKGAAFHQLLSEMDGLGYGLAWRVLDAQFFGVAQRRRRVFLVGSLGDQRAAEVLFEPESLRWDHPSSREKREGLTRAAVDRSQEGGGEGCLTPWDIQSARVYSTDNAWPTLYAGAETSGLQRQSVLAPHYRPKSYTMLVRCGCEGGGKGALIQEDVSATLSCANVQTLFQPTEDGEVWAAGFKYHQGAKAGNIGYEEEQTPTLTADYHQPAVVVIDRAEFNQGVNAQYDPYIEQTDVMDTLVARGPHAVCTFHQNQVGDVHLTEEMAGTITAGSSVSRQQLVCMADDNANAAIDVDLCGSLKVGGGRPCIAYRATEKTSSGHSAPETSRESETSTSAKGR